MENNIVITEPKFNKGDHVQNIDNKAHGIIKKDPVKNYWGWVYCFSPIKSMGNICVNEDQLILYIYDNDSTRSKTYSNCS